ncbi:MAG: transcription termination factor Rho [Gemmatimonadaceae bacterium]|nr:transcription termination factor Rho [Gemmatimonadaceae bacterium]
MNERRRPPRRGRGPRPSNPDAGGETAEPNPYRDSTTASDSPGGGDRDDGVALDPYAPSDRSERSERGERPERGHRRERGERADRGERAENATPSLDTPMITPREPGIEPSNGSGSPAPAQREEPAIREEGRGDGGGRNQGGGRHQHQQRNRDGQGNNNNGNRDGNFRGNRDGNREGGRRGRRNRGRGPRRGGEQQERGPAMPVVADGETKGWFDQGRDGGYIRRASGSYLAEPGDAFVPMQMMRQIGLRRGDLIEATTGRDQRGRTVVAEVKSVNGQDPATAARRPDFQSLVASYPERKLYLETGRPAKGGAELIRRAIDLIAPIGFGQRALIVAPARAGKTTLLHAITEGVALNHPNAVLLILLVDERPEEVSEAISWGVGEVIASSFDQPAQRHVEVTDIVLERARRLVEMGKDVVIVLDSLTRMARAHNTAERGTGRTLSGGLDAQAMAKPKAFFGSARAIPASAGGGSLTIIATALVETGSRMDDVIFEEFKGTGNSEIKLDRSLAEKRIYPAIDIATSGTRREEKLFRPEQLDSVYTLRRGLSQMPPQAGLEWLIKRIAATTSNDALLAGL